VKLLMYAFGDDPNPAPGSVAVLEDIVTEYINEMVPAHTRPCTEWNGQRGETMSPCMDNEYTHHGIRIKRCCFVSSRLSISFFVCLCICLPPFAAPVLSALATRRL
jgi:hypothetical protein